MEGWHDPDSFVRLELAPQFRNAVTCFQEIFHGRIAEDDNDVWLHRGDFAKQKRFTSLCFLGCRGTIAGWTASVNIAD